MERKILYHKPRASAIDHLFADPEDTKPDIPEEKTPPAEPKTTKAKQAIAKLHKKFDPIRDKMVKEMADKLDAQKRQYNLKVDPAYKSLVATANGKHELVALIFQDFQDKIASGCRYCQAPAATLTRISPGLGWTPQNTQPICPTCSELKGSMPEKDFLYQVKAISQAQNFVNSDEIPDIW